MGMDDQLVKVGSNPVESSAYQKDVIRALEALQGDDEQDRDSHRLPWLRWAGSCGLRGVNTGIFRLHGGTIGT